MLGSLVGGFLYDHVRRTLLLLAISTSGLAITFLLAMLFASYSAIINRKDIHELFGNIPHYLQQVK